MSGTIWMGISVSRTICIFLCMGPFEWINYFLCLKPFVVIFFQGGGDSNVILTPNGAKLNGFTLKHNGIVNGEIRNGHMALLDSQYKVVYFLIGVF